MIDLTAGDARALFRCHRVSPERVGWVPLGRFPTPVKPLERASALFGAESLHVKREDLSAEPYGGSKIRPLEFLIGEALRKDARELVTLAAYGSHLVLAAAVHAERLSLPLRAVLYPQPLNDEVRCVLSHVLSLGAEITATRSFAAALPALLLALRKARKARAGRVAFIPPGGASGIGALGFVDLAFEVMEQVKRGELPRPDYVHVPAGSCASLAGLAVGFGALGVGCRIVATRVVPRPVTWSFRIGRLIRRTAQAYEALTGRHCPRPADFVIDHDHAGRGYAHPTEEGAVMIKLFRELEGIDLDPTYTAKGAAGLHSRLIRGKGTGHHLVIHTYASPAILGPVPAIPDPRDAVLGRILGNRA